MDNAGSSAGADDMPDDLAYALQVCADLERETDVLRCGARRRDDGYLTARIEEAFNHAVAAHRLLQSLQTHVGWPSQPRRTTPRVLSPLPPVDTEAPTAILQPQPRTR